jgi:hypothetical protein
MIALLIVAVLGGSVLFTSQFKPYSPESIQAQPQRVPALSQEPRQEEVFPSGPLGLNEQQQDSQSPLGGDQTGSGEGQGSQQGALTPEQAAAMMEALREMGEQLSGDASTFELGEALQELDLDQAASALENLADQVDDLSDQTQEMLADAMQEGSDQTGESQLSEDLENAAEALREQAGEQSGEGESSESDGQSGSAEDQLDQVAQDLREMGADGSTPGMGAGNSGGTMQGQAEPAGRLQGEGDTFELEVENSSASGILTASPPRQPGSSTASGSLDAVLPGGEEGSRSPIIPNYYLWKWRDVVREYFQR